MADSGSKDANRKYSLRGSSTMPLRYRKEIGEAAGAAAAGDDSDEHTLTTPKKGTPLVRKKPTSSSAKKWPQRPESYQDDETGMFDTAELDAHVHQQQLLNQRSKSSPRIAVKPNTQMRMAALDSAASSTWTAPAPAVQGKSGGPLFQLNSGSSGEQPPAPTYPPMPTTAAMHAGLMTASLRENLRRLKNLLKLPNARKWVFSEFFYSEIDQQLFFGDNEFEQCLNETMPNLHCRRMNKIQWRKIRSLIGKPRRCSQAFFEEERVALEQKRQRIRDLYSGMIVSEDVEQLDLPRLVPPPLNVGNKVFTRVHVPDDTRRDGAFVGAIDAIVEQGYRVVFDKEQLLAPRFVNDTDVMRETPESLLPITYFLKKNAASYPHAPYAPVVLPSATVSPNKGRPDDAYPNFPIRLLVHVVKLKKAIDIKRKYIKQISELNAAAERINLHAPTMPEEFQHTYAEVLLDVEAVNKALEEHLKHINELQQVLWPQLNSNSSQIRTEGIRRQCQVPAAQIVKHCNNGLGVRSHTALKLITSLTALLLQVRSMGQSNCSPVELRSLTDALSDIRLGLQPNNAAAFQDHVEVHMKQIHNLMLQAASQQPKYAMQI